MPTLTPIQNDACAGIAILYMGPDSLVDDYVERLHLAMECGDTTEAEHVSAIMIAALKSRVSEASLRLCAEQWATAWGRWLT